MASVNKVIIVGRLGKDPETRYLPDGTCIANISVATEESWKDKNSGEKKSVTEWHRINFFGKLAEIVEKYLVKGALVYIEGRLVTSKWTDKENIERYVTEIKADSMQMLGSKQDGGGSNQSGTQSPSTQRSSSQQNNRTAPQRQQQNFSDMDDSDIPF